MYLLSFVMIFGFVSGSILGSFVKVLADRSLSKKSFLGRSYCPFCKEGLRWYDLFPVASYILLNGRCRYCHKKIGTPYLWIEVGMGVLIGLLFWQSFQFSITLLDLLFKTFFIVVLAVLFLTDLKKMLIPDRIIKPAIIIALILLIIKAVYTKSAEPLYMGILMAILIGGFFFSLIVITKGKGMGGGDAKLGAFIGLMLGFPQALFALMLAFLTGAVFSIGLIIIGKKHFGQTIPFGPFLVLGSLIMLFWGKEIINWYLHLGT